MELIKTFLSENKEHDIIYNEIYYDHKMGKYKLFNIFVDYNILSESWIDWDEISNYSDLDLSKIYMNNPYDILFLYQTLISFYGFINFDVDVSCEFILLNEYRVNKIKENSTLNYCKVLTIGYN